MSTSPLFAFRHYGAVGCWVQQLQRHRERPLHCRGKCFVCETNSSRLPASYHSEQYIPRNVLGGICFYFVVLTFVILATVYPLTVVCNIKRL